MREFSRPEKIEKPVDAKKEVEVLRKEFEYRDAGGNLLGKAKIELGDMEDAGDGKIGRQLRSLRLVGEKDGRETQLNLLNLANKFVAKIYVGEAPLKDSYYRGEENRVWVSALETPIGLATLLHELGHSGQWKEKGKFQEIKKIYWRSREFFKAKNEGKKLSDDFLESSVEAISKAIPEAAKLEDDERILSLPREVMERDAWARALKWLRIIRERTGINFFKNFKAPEKSLLRPFGAEDCVSYLLEALKRLGPEELETTVLAEMKNALKHVEAEKSPGVKLPEK